MCEKQPPRPPVFYLTGCLVNPILSITWICGQFDRFSFIIFSLTSTPSSQEPSERASWLLPRLQVACYFCFFGCLELFSNSHLSVLREFTSWVSFCSHYHPLTWLSWEPSDLSGLEPDNHLWVSFWDCGPPIKRTSLPHLIILGTFWSEWTRSDDPP
jgi:hypothetical protein